MKVLIACEFSGVVREAFRKLGHDAYSCDLLPSLDNSPYHIQGDIMHNLNGDYDLMIAHPPCTFLCNSGVRWLKDNKSRQDDLFSAKEFWYVLRELSNIPKICMENPIPHKYAKYEPMGIGDYDQLIQPWQFGHGETKATCLWLKNLPKLVPTNVVSGREQRIHKMPPSKDRGMLRSITYQGIADAMAEQWGKLND